MATKAPTRKQRDDPRLWAALDRFHEACLWGALNGVFDLKEDARVNKAHAACDIEAIKKITAKRLKAVGSKPKFKKVPIAKRGLRARKIIGSMAYAGMLYEHKLFGKPKGKPEKAEKKKKKKAEKPKPVVKRELGPPNPDLPQNNAYTQARGKIKKSEILLYIVHNDGPSYTATYYNKKTKKRRILAITAISVERKMPWDEQMRKYRKRLALYYDAKEAKKKPLAKAKPKKAKAKKRGK